VSDDGGELGKGFTEGRSLDLGSCTVVGGAVFDQFGGWQFLLVWWMGVSMVVLPTGIKPKNMDDRISLVDESDEQH